ncbi:transcriptional regulator, LysR family [Rhizobiales bacterium GAS113]|nr:transcriptional regulator, LysR family [Rhizobiales bacterium GAS113]SED72587.1 transcriptional regulator, LysR family [Rhizobiales bacterium GAS188]
MRRTDLRHVDLNLLLVLHNLLETRSTVATAQRLNMSQPAVSRALARLRLLFDDKLLVKGAGSMLPTERALVLSNPLIGVLNGLEEFLEAPRFSPVTTERVFRIATTDYGALALLPNLLRLVATEAPRSAIEISAFSREAFRCLATGELELVLFSSGTAPSNLHSCHLFTDDYASAIRRGHPAAAHLRDGEMRLDAYLAYSHILVSVFGDRTGVVDEALVQIGRRRKIAAQLPYFATAALMTASTDAILTLPGRAMRQLSDANNLITFRPPLQIKSFDYRMIWHERSSADFGAVWLREKMAQAAATPL